MKERNRHGAIMIKKTIYIFFIFTALLYNSAVALASLPKSFPVLESLGLKPQPIEYPFIPQPQNGASEKEPLYDLSFGKITQEQYLRVKAIFLNKTEVPYSKDKVYFLTDFLPPQMQALYGMGYNTPFRKLRGFDRFMYGDNLSDFSTDDEVTIGSTAFCYGTAWNTILALQARRPHITNFELGHFSSEIAEQYLLDDRYGTEVQKGLSPAFGDLFPHFRQNSLGHFILIHVPIYLVDGLVFEKEDSHAHTPFRIISLGETTKSLRVSVKNHFGEKVIVGHRRLIRVGKEKLPKISQVAVYGGPEGQEARDFFGKYLADRLTMTHDSSLGGGIRRNAEFLLRIHFNTNLDGRGVIASSPLKQRRYFFSAYKGIQFPPIELNCNDQLGEPLENQ